MELRERFGMHPHNESLLELSLIEALYGVGSSGEAERHLRELHSRLNAQTRALDSAGIDGNVFLDIPWNLSVMKLAHERLGLPRLSARKGPQEK